MINVFAKESAEYISGKIFEFDKKSQYEIDDDSSLKTIRNSSEYGKFNIEGNIKSILNVDNTVAYEVSDGNVNLMYNVLSTYNNAPDGEWHIYDDKSKTINGEKIDNNILSGAIILQTSFTKDKWITEAVFTDISNDETEFDVNFYTSKNIQQINGCFYRVIVAYELEKITATDKSVKNWSGTTKEYKKCAEVYEFYLINSDENTTDVTLPTDTPKQDLGTTKINTGKDNGYSGSQNIDDKDPHFGWNIGTFFVNGYTRETQDEYGNPIFLKNVGDRVTLWFRLEQDINNLNGNSKLTINEDVNGYDQYFEVEKTNFKRGTLIIRFTDYEGKKGEPIIYTDYLAANAITGADTKVELFEEGDYEVALDYEIKDSSGIDSYTNYRIYFEFSIRNGNCMVYPFDVKTGNELTTDMITENGFKLDMAKSRYLTIDVEKEAVVIQDNKYKLDERFNRPAKDGEEYIAEGVYTFTVKNLYANTSTTKVIYVGTSPVIKAMANGVSINEINAALEEGAEFTTDGVLEFVEIKSSETESEAEYIENESIQPIKKEETEGKYDDSIVATDDSETIVIDSSNNSGLLVSVVVIGIAVIIILFISIRRKR
jgi:hypothetical protein